MPKTILIIEDDPKIRSGLKDNLEFEGYRVLEAWSASDGTGFWRGAKPDLVLLDIMLPGRSGFQLLGTMRAAGFATPVIILSARGEEWDKVKGFRLGCDDYVVKPFGLLELLERIAAVLRRADRSEEDDIILILDGLQIDLSKSEVELQGRRSILVGRLFDLLIYFVRNFNRVIPRKELLEKVWHSTPEIETRTVDMSVVQLRRLLENSSYRIETVYKVGYRLCNGN